MDIDLPNLEEQRKIVFAAGTEKGCEVLRENLKAPHIASQGLDISAYGTKHLRSEDEGWEAPQPELIYAFFEQFKTAFPEYGTDEKLAHLLGMHVAGDRRIRAFKKGEKNIPYGIWRRFLVLTGRANQEIIPVIAFFKD